MISAPDTYHRATPGQVEFLQELDRGTLPAAAAADQGQGLSRLDRHCQTAQDTHVQARWVTEADILKLDLRVVVLLKIWNRNKRTPSAGNFTNQPAKFNDLNKKEENI